MSKLLIVIVYTLDSFFSLVTVTVTSLLPITNLSGFLISTVAFGSSASAEISIVSSLCVVTEYLVEVFSNGS